MSTSDGAATVRAMAETVHLYLAANGTDIKGESTQVSLGREGSIECLYFESEVGTAREAGSGLASGRRQYKPLVIRKRIDKSTPLLAKALCDNEKVEGTFKFFRPNPAGDGTTEQFFTVKLTNGRIDGIDRLSPNALDPAEAKAPPLETVRIVYHTITWTFVPTGAEYVDSWDKSDS